MPGNRAPRWKAPLAEDGELDEIAIDILARGTRPIRATLREIEAAAAIIIRQGGYPRLLRERLGVPERMAAKLAREAGFDKKAWNNGWSVMEDGILARNMTPAHPERQRYITRHGGKAWKKEESVAGMVVSTGGPGASFRT